MTIKTNAQIPNNDFENWPLSSYGWPVGNPIQSNDVYPVGVGNYSLKLQNNAGGTNYSDFGFCVTFPTPGSWAPSFPITGHPNSFTGYYKFFPINGDTAVIGAILYFNGDTVSTAILRVNTTVASWTPFDIPFTNYTTADSASIGFSAYNWVFGQPGMPTLHGNSELYIDNVNFDNLINFIYEPTLKETAISIFPNPASKKITIDINNRNKDDLTMNVYNLIGTLVKSEKLKQNQQQVNVGDLETGVYMVEIKYKEWAEMQKLIIQR